MSDHAFDKVFRRKAGDGVMPVPAGMWESIEARLPAPRRDRRPVFFWIGGAGVLAVASFLWWKMDSAIQHEMRATETVDMETAYNPPTEALAIPVSVESNKINDNDLTVSAIPTGTRYTDARSHTGNATRRMQNEHAHHETSLIETDEVQHSISPRLPEDAEMLPSSTMLLSHVRKWKTPDPPTGCYDFGDRSGLNGKWFVEGYTGPSFPTKQLTSRSEDVSSYIAMRNASEFTKLSWHGGVRGGFRHHSGLSVRTGAHYTHVHEVFDYYNGSVTQTFQRIDSVFDAGGNIIRIDTTIVTQRGQRIKRTHNRFHSIDIPLLIGYEITHLDWNYGIQAGPVFNVAFATRGDILAPDSEPVSISSNNPNAYPAFRDNLGVGFYASVHIGRQISDRLLLYGEPYLHRCSRSLTQDSYPVDQRQTLFGLSAGLRLILN